jgi:hypothetical protein
MYETVAHAEAVAGRIKMRLMKAEEDHRQGKEYFK